MDDDEKRDARKHGRELEDSGRTLSREEWFEELEKYTPIDRRLDKKSDGDK